MGNPCLTRYCAVKADVFLQIGHGTSLALRTIAWQATEKQIKTPIIGRKDLELLGRCSKAMFLAARDRLGDNIDIIDRLFEDGNENETESTIAELYGDNQ